MSNDKVEKWEEYYKNLQSLMFPNEYVLRIFAGKYPNLELPKNYKGKKVCDVSCGDGRNLVLLNKLKFDIYGTEITEDICRETQNKLISELDIDSVPIVKGNNENLHFDDGYFDYLLSWNAIYYLNSPESDIRSHVHEYARILKKGGYLVCSVPTKNCYSLLNCTTIKDNVVKLNPTIGSSWGGGFLAGSLFYLFQEQEHIEEVFGEHFINFRWGKISDDCFGLPLEYNIFVCQKK